MDDNKPTGAGGETQLPTLRPEAPLHNSAFERLWSQLTPTQRKYVIARQKHATKVDAATSIDVDRTTIYKWGPEVEACVEALQLEAARGAIGIMQQGLAQAASVFVDALDSPSERTRLEAAQAIVERFLGKTKQEVDLHHSGKVEATPITVYLPANHRDVTDAVDADFDEDDV